MSEEDGVLFMHFGPQFLERLCDKQSNHLFQTTYQQYLESQR